MHTAKPYSLKQALLGPDIKAFIFDLDGVIIDSEPIHLQISNDMIEHLGLAVPWDEYEQFIGMTDIAYFTYLKNYANLDAPVPELIAEYKRRLDIFFNEAIVLPIISGIRELVETLRAEGILLAIASSSSHVNIRHVLRAARLTDYFPIQVSGEDVEHGKPAPDIYLEAARQLAVAPEHCAAIEDSEAGSLSAKRAGLYTIGFQNPGSGKQNLSSCHLVIHEIQDLLVEA